MAKGKSNIGKKVAIILFVITLLIVVVLLIVRAIRNSISADVSKDFEDVDENVSSSSGLNCDGATLDDAKVLKKGDKSCEVIALQQKINELNGKVGNSTNISVDGSFGNQTMSALQDLTDKIGWAAFSDISLNGIYLVEVYVNTIYW
jgi:ABC-type multidrug transport system fused ATPase/permease subunit